MRAVVFAAALSVALSAAAFADEKVSGNWHANLGRGVAIDMNVNPDGSWNSVTLQRNKVIRQLRGTYKQTPSSDLGGTIVFTPTQAKVQGGSVGTETDTYEMVSNGSELKLTADGDTMLFKKQKGH